jgi:hypothetical protein
MEMSRSLHVEVGLYLEWQWVAVDKKEELITHANIKNPYGLDSWHTLVGTPSQLVCHRLESMAGVPRRS